MAKRLRRTLVLPALFAGLLLAVLEGLASSDSSSFLRWPEYKTLDLDYYGRSWLAAGGHTDPDVVVLGIDDKTLDYQHVRYDVSWRMWAELLERVGAAKPKAVFFDFVMTVPSPVARFHDAMAALRSSMDADPAVPPARKQQVDRLEVDMDFDDRLSRAMASVPLVLPVGCISGVAPGAVAPSDPRAEEQREKISAKVSWIEPRESIQPLSVLKLLDLQPRFSDAAAEIAHTCELPDSDNVLRGEPYLLRLTAVDEERWMPSVALVLARRALDVAPADLRVEDRDILLGDKRIPFDRTGNGLLAVNGPGLDFRRRAMQGQPNYYVVRDFLEGTVPPSRLAGKVVLIGLTNGTSSDSKLTPFAYNLASRTPGVEKIAVQTDAILRQVHLGSRPDFARFGFLLTVVLSVLGALAGAAFSARVSLVALVAGVGAVLFGGIAAFTWGEVWLDSFYPTAGFGLALGVSAAMRYAAQESAQRYLREAFDKYLDPQMVQRLLESRDALRLFGEDRELTILFADLRGFTSTSENATPAEIVKLLNSHLTAMSDVILRHHGTLDKFVGDCVMAFWGAPIEDPDHAKHAVEAAIEMLEVMDRQNAGRIANGERPVDMGVGINTGRVIVGNMGSTSRFDYTVIGDAVNLASRLEGLTKATPSRVLIGQRTWQLVWKEIPCVELGQANVKGKVDAVPIFGPEAAIKDVSATPAATPEASGGTG